MNRRRFLGVSGAAAAGAWIGHAQAADARIELRPAEAGAEISPHIYGHFIEHIGGVIYDGIWLGRGSRVANVEGIRKQFVDDMRRIGAPNLRWPGGCFADGYHWRDGIGSKRPRTYNFWHPRMPAGTDSTELNTFGTGEFLRLCELTGAAPYIAGNVASGTARELHDWVLYCNAPAGSVTQAEERAAAGHPAPYNVRYWGIGNESWGCGGLFKPHEYAQEYRRFVAQFPAYTPPFLIAAGPNTADLNWTRGFFGAVFGAGRQAPVHGWALHYYTHHRSHHSKAIDFTAPEWYGVLDAGARMDRLIEDHWKAMGEFDRDHKVKLVVDEWGTWYPEGTEVQRGYLFSQIMTLRDALHTAINLDIFNRHADKVAMANVAQTINCLHSLFLAAGDRYVRTPAFHVFEMYMPHKGGRSVPASFEAAPVDYTFQGGAHRMFRLTGSASLRGRQVTLTLVHTSLDGPVETAVSLAGAAAREARGRVLTHEEMRAANTFAAPETVAPAALPVTVRGGGVRFRLPARSVAAIEIQLG